jgi:hypothetical protein
MNWLQIGTIGFLGVFATIICKNAFISFDLSVCVFISLHVVTEIR